nr:MAG TPA: hypothetical protein [Caudoviricetes sp.]
MYATIVCIFTLFVCFFVRYFKQIINKLKFKSSIV